MQQQGQVRKVLANPRDFVPVDLHGCLPFPAIYDQDDPDLPQSAEQCSEVTLIDAMFVMPGENLQSPNAIGCHVLQQVVRMGKFAGMVGQSNPARSQSWMLVASLNDHGIAYGRVYFFRQMGKNKGAVHLAAFHLGQQLFGGPWGFRIFSGAPADSSKAVKVSYFRSWHALPWLVFCRCLQRRPLYQVLHGPAHLLECLIDILRLV